MSRASASRAGAGSSVTHVRTYTVTSMSDRLRPARLAPASTWRIEAGTAAGGIQVSTTPSATSPASSHILGPSAAR